MNRDQQYLGDGVYISHDGYQIWLSVNDANNPVVALEPGLPQKIVDYERRIFGGDSK